MNRRIAAAIAVVLVSVSAASASPGFVANHGQWDDGARFVFLRGSDCVWLERSALTIDRSIGDQRHVLRIEFESASDSVVLEPGQRSPGVYHFFRGNDPASWRVDVPAFQTIEYRGLYPGIDLVVRTEQDTVVYDLVLHPGSDPTQFRARCDGAETIAIGKDGSLELGTSLGLVQHTPPRTFAMLRGGSRRPIASRFRLHGDRTYGFALGAMPADVPVVIDPGIEWATFLGGSIPAIPAADLEVLNAVDVAPDGSVTLCGRNGQIDFPTTTGPSYAGSTEAFVTRLNADGTALVFSTFLGGTGGDEARAIAVAEDGSTIVAGDTQSSDFPTTAGAFMPATPTNPGASTSGYVTKLSPSGGALVFSTLLGGDDYESLYGVAVDDSHHVVAVGFTASTDFPITAGAFDPTELNGEGFVTRLFPDGTGIVYSTFLGGMSNDHCTDVAVDAAGYATVVGDTACDFPTTPGAFDPTGTGCILPEAFVTRFDPAGTALFSTKLSDPTGGGTAAGVALDALGQATVTGLTGSGFPTTPGVWLSTCPGACRYVARLNLSGTALVWSTFVFGFALFPADLAVDSRGGTVLALDATSAANFPFPPGSFDPVFDGSEPILIRLDREAKTALYATTVGGSGSDGSGGHLTHPIDLDASDSAVLIGATASADFPVTAGAFSTQLSGPTDGFIAKLDLLPTGVSKYGAATPGCAGKAAIGITAMPQVGSTVVLTCGRAPPSVAGFLLVSSQAVASPVPVSGFDLWIDPFGPFFLFPIQVDPSGCADVPLPLPAAAVSPGARGFLQFVFPDSCAPGGYAASNALDVTVQQ